MIFCKNCRWCPSHLFPAHLCKVDPHFSTHCYQGFKLVAINKNAHKPWKKPKYEVVQKGLKICSLRLSKGEGVPTRFQRITFDVDIV